MKKSDKSLIGRPLKHFHWPKEITWPHQSSRSVILPRALEENPKYLEDKTTDYTYSYISLFIKFLWKYFFFLIEVKLHSVKCKYFMYTSVDFYIHPWTHHPNQDIEHFSYPGQCPVPPHTHTNNCYSDLYHHGLLLSVLKLHVNVIIICTLVQHCVCESSMLRVAAIRFLLLWDRKSVV